MLRIACISIAAITPAIVALSSHATFLSLFKAALQAAL